MSSRREFIQRGLAASALAASPLTARLAQADGSGREPYRFFTVLFDPTFADGAAFGAEAVRLGAPASAAGSDAGSVWMNQIEPRWKHGPAVVAGLTGRASLFCLELLARDYGMGVVYRAEHSPAPGGGIRHSITGPERLAKWESRLTLAGKRWSALAAEMAMSCPEALAPDPGIGLLDLGQPSRIVEPSLFSWVIAPARRAGVLGRSRYQERGTHNRPQRG
jgi:hypothetical protein